MNAKYALKHGQDSLGGDYEQPITISEHDTLAGAIHAQLESGNGYIEHLATGLQRHALPHDGGDDVIWIDSDGNRHPAPAAD